MLVRISKIYLNGYRSVSVQEFDAGPFTVLFGKNNAGKTNLLEAIYSVLSPDSFSKNQIRRDLRSNDGAFGAVYVDLDRGFEFDDAVLSLLPSDAQGGFLRLRPLPNAQACFASTPVNESLPKQGDEQELWFVDLRDYWEQTDAHGLIVDEERDEIHVVDEQTRLVGSEPRLRPLFLGWEFANVDAWVTEALAKLTQSPYHWEEAVDGHRYLPTETGLLEPVDDVEPTVAWRVRPEVHLRVNQLAMLATDLLPDFVDGSIHTEIHVPTQWVDSPKVSVLFEERNGARHPIGDFGRGYSRWLAIAVQLALHLMEDRRHLCSIDASQTSLSGNVLFVDEPEAHLHPSAVSSSVRWCQRMVRAGFNIVTATHHEEFLRGPVEETTFVNVGRDVADSCTTARTLHSRATRSLQDLALAVGLHPAAALSIHRAILLVEGPLDEAVLDEYAGHELDAAGVKIVPIHGSKNIEGLIDVEIVTGLGIKIGILTDNTDTDTMRDKSNNKRSSEEVHVMRALKIFEDKELPPPTPFGVPEADLLFALPADGIRDFLQEHQTHLDLKERIPFPGWEELVAECRSSLGKGPSDSVNWKAFASDRYGLDIKSPMGVRHLVQQLDLRAVPFPSIRRVVNEITQWAGN